MLRDVPVLNSANLNAFSAVNLQLSANFSYIISMIKLSKIIYIMHGCLIVIVIAISAIFYLCIHSTHFGVINSHSLSPIFYHCRVIVISYVLSIASILVISAFRLTCAFI